MSIDRVSTAQQSAYLLSQITQDSNALTTTQNQIASQKVATTYAGFGSQAQVLTATIAANARNTAYQGATTLATTQAATQDTQLTSLSTLAQQLNTAISTAVSSNDPTGLMSQVQSIFSQATAILNSQDANGNYIYSGGKTTAPVTVTSLSQLAGVSPISGAFNNGDIKQSVEVADGQTITYGMTASDIGTDLMQSLQQIASFDAGGTGDFDGSTSLSSAQSSFLTAQIGTTTTATDNLNAVTAQNGYAQDALTNAGTQQSSMSTLYSGFISNIQDTNMAQAATQLSLQQTALQAALQVTASLNQLTLLNYLPTTSTG